MINPVTRRLIIMLVIGQIVFDVLVLANFFAQKAWQEEATENIELLLRNIPK